MIFVDTGAWYELWVPEANRHAEAKRWFAQNRQRLVTTDYVIDETLTLLRARGHRYAAHNAGDGFSRRFD